MGRIYQCVGHYAETAYTIKRTWIHIYCVEELCYYICNNAYLLEEDFINQDMLLWLDSECMLSSLAKTLRAQIRQGVRLEDQVRLLLETVHYCPAEEIDAIVGMIAANYSMNSLQKNKIRADYFLKNERYALALQAYEELTEELAKVKDDKLIASVYYNMGVIYAHLFLFGQAGEYFKMAYEKQEKEEYQVAYLAIRRMVGPDAGYLKLIGENEEYYQASRVLEHMMDKVDKDWKISDEHMRIMEMRRLRETGNMEKYSRQVEQMNNACKELYRNMVIE
ncbi:MAG: hypothetical protein K2J95_05065 [Lachnospiraceae bacterium]|nr:hypothetical protein [Lachnospiraceae bacterium]